MILTVNSDYFLKQQKPVDLCNGEELCFLCGTDWILKYYSNKLRLQRVKHPAMKTRRGGGGGGSRLSGFFRSAVVSLCYRNQRFMSECVGAKRVQCCIGANPTSWYSTIIISGGYMKSTYVLQNCICRLAIDEWRKLHHRTCKLRIATMSLVSREYWPRLSRV
jgi:hypothetical protein